MNILAAISLVLLTSPTLGDQKVGFPVGKYTGSEIATRISVSGRQIRTVGSFCHHSYYLNLKDRPVNDLLRLFQDGIGIELRKSPSGLELGFSSSELGRQKAEEKELDEKVKAQFKEMLERLRNGFDPVKDWHKNDKIGQACIAYDSLAASNPRLFTSWYLSTHNLSDLRKRSFVYCGSLEKLFKQVRAPQWLKDDYLNRWFSFKGDWGGGSLYRQIEEAKKSLRECEVFFRISYTPLLKSFFVIEERIPDSQSGGLSQGAFLPIPEYVGRLEDWYPSREYPPKKQPEFRLAEVETIQDWISDADLISKGPALLTSQKNVNGVEVVRYIASLLSGIQPRAASRQLSEAQIYSMSFKDAVKHAGRLSDHDLLVAQSNGDIMATKSAVLLPFLRLVASLTDSEKELIEKSLGEEWIAIDLGLVRKQDRQALYRAMRNIVHYPSNMMQLMEIDNVFVRAYGDDPFKDCYLMFDLVGCSRDLEVRIGKYSKDKQEGQARISTDFPHSDISYVRAIAFQCPFIVRSNGLIGR